MNNLLLIMKKLSLLSLCQSRSLSQCTNNGVQHHLRKPYPPPIHDKLSITPVHGFKHHKRKIYKDKTASSCLLKEQELKAEKPRFEVLDEEPGDDEEGGGQRKHNVPVSHVIPFPKPNDPSGAQDFPLGSPVLAVYPGTTALYKATVVNSRKMTFLSSVRLHLFMEFGLSTNFVVHVAGALLFFKHPEEDSYLLEFDDDEEDGAMPPRTVHFFNVVPLPEGHRR